jgi:hypothetical protein
MSGWGNAGEPSSAGRTRKDREVWGAEEDIVWPEKGSTALAESVLCTESDVGAEWKE